MPGGDLHRVEIAFLYGADAVYVGLSRHSLRKAEVDFSISDLKKAITIAHSLKKKIYVTFNVFAHEAMLPVIKKDLKTIAALGPDAFIIADPGIVNLAKSVAPQIPIHLSTQANTLNSESVKFWLKQGVKRIVLARETTLADIKMIKKALPADRHGVPKMELEVFAHGAMCISYSGRCLASAYLTGRSANLGMCAQPCRWNYNVYLEEETRPGELFQLEEDERGSYLMSSKDLCLIEHLDELAEAGVDALKIEGRNKTDYYVAVAAKAYRCALNLLKNGKYNLKEKKALKTELENLAHRGYTTGFLFGAAKSGETYNSRQPLYGKKYVGYISKVIKDGWAEVVVKNKIEANQKYELVVPTGNVIFKVEAMKDQDKEITTISPGQKDKKVLIKTSKILSTESFLREII